MTELKGIIVPIVTPMNEDESVNLEELRRQVDRQIGHIGQKVCPPSTYRRR